ncbi:MAG: branched-chain amino acid ABC transporter permease [Candidatus Eremiobacteraeota bacterium]|nr:branched-chain amino acid ABC transporter permease [Candidatus Eremiobacteraeota bacterium]
MLTIAAYFVVLATCWNLLAGMTGQFSLATQTFAAIGAYATGMSIYYAHVPIWLGIVIAVLIASGFGLLLGVLVLRMRTIYLAIATWAFAETVHITLGAAYNITRGELGLSVPALFPTLDPTAYFFVFLTLAAMVTLFAWGIARSPLGTFMRAIKDDELRAESVGINTTAIKILVFTLTSGITGLAGAFYAHYVAILSPNVADFSVIGMVITMVVIGGLGTVAAPLIGAPIVVVLNESLSKYGEWDLAIFALIVILLMRTSTGGIPDAARRLALVVHARGGGPSN